MRCKKYISPYYRGIWWFFFGCGLLFVFVIALGIFTQGFDLWLLFPISLNICILSTSIHKLATTFTVHDDGSD